VPTPPSQYVSSYRRILIASAIKLLHFISSIAVTFWFYEKFTDFDGFRQWSPVKNSQSQQQHRPRSIDLSGLQNVAQSSGVFASTEPGEMRTLTKAIDGGESGLLSRGSTVDGPDEEAVVYNSTRMLQDPTGRLLYVGDAATLSFLQLIRMIVDNVVGPTPFTMDPKRHRIVESSSSLPPNIRRTHLLPDRQTANVLVEAYFTNVSSSSSS
jgi:hypothetical protein